MKGEHFHKFIRREYPPEKYPSMYTSPEAMTRRLAQANQVGGKQTRKAHKRAKVSVREKNTLLRDVDMKKIELEDKKSRIKELERDIEAAIPVIAQLREHRDIWRSLPKTIREDFENFAERYV